ncbi:LuxR family transcriptional regulator [Enterobacter ludwigii]|nr:LuxR family transcriptional regulator [Enterobacter ludwigii]
MQNSPHVKICVNDDNLAFKAGLQSAIHDYFKNKNIYVSFVSSVGDNINVDIIIQAIGSGISNLTLYARKFEAQHKQWIAVCEKSERRFVTVAKYSNLMGVIYRDDKINDVIRMVEYAIHHRKRREDIVRYYRRDIQKLTCQERKILNYIREGLSYEQIANELRINTKTVSTHKCTVMRKLDMKRNIELHHWLSAGGLKNEE